MNNKTLLVIAKGGDFGSLGDAVYYLIVAETGECLCSHVCSHEGFAMGDLYSHRAERIIEYTKRFGEIEVKHLRDTNISEDELIARNTKWKESVSDDTKVDGPRIEITIDEK